MKALVTGASSGIGREMALYLDSLDVKLILLGRNQERLEELNSQLKNPSKIIIADLSTETKVKEIYVLIKQENIDILVNNAGFGVHGDFKDTDLSEELKMINTNIVAPHILTKLVLKDFIKKDSGYILNVSSAANFMPGPKMATYYGTKSYIYQLTLGIYEELKREKSKVSISVLCPGYVDTEFSKRMGVTSNPKGSSPKKVAKYAIDNMFKKKLVIIPTFKIRLGVFMTKFLSLKTKLSMSYRYQNKRKK